MADELESRLQYLMNSIKKLGAWAIKHYLIISSLSALFFTGISYIYVTNYFELWGINFFDYATVADLYSVAFRARIIPQIITTILFTFSTGITVFLMIKVLVKEFKYSLPEEVSTLIVVVCICASFLVITSITSIPSSRITKMTPDIADEAARVNLKLRFNKEPIKCASIIAGVTDYMFVWNQVTRKPLALSRANVASIEYYVDSIPPLKSDTKGAAKRPVKAKFRSEENVLEVEAWTKELLSKCGQIYIDK